MDSLSTRLYVYIFLILHKLILILLKSIELLIDISEQVNYTKYIKHKWYALRLKNITNNLLFHYK